MELKDSFTVSAPPSEVWALFWDLPRVGRCLPGCEDIQALDDGSYRARLAQRVGNRLKLNRLSLELNEAQGGTQVHYSIDFALFGRLASLGNSVVKRKAEEARREFSRCIAAELGSA
jgi:carbon monoxide dehydrogenase subunit G